MILLLVAAAQASILTKTRHPVSDRWLLALETVNNNLNELSKAAPQGISISIDKDSCSPYDPKNKEKAVNICIASHNEQDNSMSIEFRSPASRFELEFANIDVNDPASDIKLDPYVKEFIAALNDLVLTEELRKATIEEAVKAGGADLQIADLAIAADKITYTYKGKANTVTSKMTGDLLEFSTDFFQDSIDLNIPLKKFINFEVKKLFKEIIDHLYQMQRFALSDGDTAAQSIKTLTCEKLMGDADITAAATERMSKNGLTFKAEGTTVSFEKDSKAITLTCTPTQVGDFNVLEVKGDFAAVAPTIQPISQGFLEKSLYNLTPVFASFIGDLGLLAIRLLADKNVEEAFEDVVANAQTGEGR